MLTLLSRAGFRSIDDPEAASVLIVNTCGFIEPAREESLATLQDLAETLTPSQRLIAAGCWAQRDPELLLEAIPQLDAVIGTRSWHQIVPLVERLLASPAQPLRTLAAGAMALPEAVGAPGYALSGASAFLKIADGCSRRCAFCAIPLIKGDAVSRPIPAILEDARALQAQGVLELNLIAQDTTHYGHDLGMKEGLATLLEQLVAAVPDIPWIRVLYAFPGYITARLIDVLAAHPQLLPYVDIPLQHAHPAVLRRMNRPADLGWVRRTVATLRERLPGVALRTTFIVGFPGETDEEFETLLDFVEELAFDRVGAFIYSAEPGTAAAALPDDIPLEVKEARREALMVAQQAISLRANLALVGQRLPVLLEGAGDGLTVGRTYRDAPEIDGLVLIGGEHACNRLATVEIIDATVYDLFGELV